MKNVKDYGVRIMSIENQIAHLLMMKTYTFKASDVRRIECDILKLEEEKDALISKELGFAL